MTKYSFNNPCLYSANNLLQYNFAMKMLSKISFNLKSRILDIGCGDGLITYEMAKLAKQGCIIGTDISNKMISYANETYRFQKNLRFLQMDSTQNIFNQQFDIVTSFNCLHWVKDQESALNGLMKAIIPGGQVVILLSHKKSLYHKVLDRLSSSDQWKQYFNDYQDPRCFFEKNDYESLLKKVGLSISNIEEQEMIHHYSSVDDLKSFLMASNNQVKYIPQHLKELFLNHFTKEYLEGIPPRNSDQGIPLGFYCLQVIGNKLNESVQQIVTPSLSFKP